MTINCPYYCNFLRTQCKMNKYRDKIKSMVIILSIAPTITIKSVCLWGIDKGCGTPNAHCAVI